MISVYTKNNCIWCERAKEFLASNSIPFNLFVLGENFDKDWLKAQFPTATTFPVIVDNGKYIGGYTDMIAEAAKNQAFGKELLLG